MATRVVWLLTLFTLCGWAGTILTAQTVLTLEEVASGFDKPLEVIHAGDERLFVVEQPGRIRILWPNGTVAAEPFLDITDRVNDNANERGLLGLAFHPQFADNGWFYVNYTGTGGHTVISRFSLSADSNEADAQSELILLQIDQPFANHNGGCLRFGPDGYLYIGMGDGGAGGDPLNAAQDPQSLLGKMLRIDVDGPTPYAIPSDNPFAQDSAGRDEIWALGLRNPWRFSFDQLSGDLWVADVGQNEWEEINFLPAGSMGGTNFGWRCYEGLATYNLSGCASPQAYTFPIHVYANSNAVGRSVTGGYVYRGQSMPALYGHYIFGDFVSGRIWALLYDPTSGTTQLNELLDFADYELSSFGQDVFGELYACGYSSGKVFRLVDQCASLSLSANVMPPSCPDTADGTIAIEVVGAQGTPSLMWSHGGVGALQESLPAGTYGVTLTDALGCMVVDSFVLQAPPIDTPSISVTGALLSVPDQYAAYQWLLDGHPIDGANAPQWEAQVSGSYSIEVHTDNGCIVRSEQVAIVLTNAQFLPEGIQHVQVVPNPFSEEVWLQIETSYALSTRVVVCDLQGRVVWQHTLQLNGRQDIPLSLAHLPKGVWQVYVCAGTTCWVGSVVKR